MGLQQKQANCKKTLQIDKFLDQEYKPSHYFVKDWSQNQQAPKVDRSGMSTQSNGLQNLNHRSQS